MYMAAADTAQPSFSFPSVNERGPVHQIMCHVAEEMDMLGALIVNKGRMMPANYLRLGKADRSVHMHAKILCYRNPNFQDPFTEYVKRIVPVALHACSSWAWDTDTWQLLHSWQRKALAIIMTAANTKKSLPARNFNGGSTELWLHASVSECLG